MKGKAETFVDRDEEGSNLKRRSKIVNGINCWRKIPNEKGDVTETSFRVLSVAR